MRLRDFLRDQETPNSLFDSPMSDIYVDFEQTQDVLGFGGNTPGAEWKALYKLAQRAAPASLFCISHRTTITTNCDQEVDWWALDEVRSARTEV